jgi:pimeloyl-ACP methyl ester carboxylesterase
MNTRITEFHNGELSFPVRDSGPLEGEPVLLLHGWPQDGSSWEPVAAHLNEAGYRTFAPTLRGVTPGANPRRRGTFRSSELRSDVAAMIAAIGGPVHLVGHDWGAALAWGVATHRPELLRSLTAVSVPHPAAFLRSLYTSPQGLSSWYMYFFQLPVLPELVLGSSWFMTRSLMTTGQARGAARRDARRNGTHALRRGGLNWYRGAVLEPRDHGAPTPVPVLQVWSDGDTAILRHGIERTHAYAAGDYRLSVLEGVSHWIPDEAPERLADEIIRHLGVSPEVEG